MGRPRTLEAFPPSRKPAGRPTEYPWEEWTDGEIRELIQGEHFHCKLKSLRALIHLTASKRGLRASTSITEKTVKRQDGMETQYGMVVAFYKPEP